MKTIYIIEATEIFPEHKAVTEKICHELNGKYQWKIYDIRSREQMQELLNLNKINPVDCQMIINLDMTGYQCKTTSNVATIETLGINNVNYITQPFGLFEVFFARPFNYLTSFVVNSKETCDVMMKKHPELWHVHYCEDIGSLCRYIDALDWRY